MIGYSDKLLQTLVLVLIVLNLYLISFNVISSIIKTLNFKLKLMNDNLGEFF